MSVTWWDEGRPNAEQQAKAEHESPQQFGFGFPAQRAGPRRGALAGLSRKTSTRSTGKSLADAEHKRCRLIRKQTQSPGMIFFFAIFVANQPPFGINAARTSACLPARRNLGEAKPAVSAQTERFGRAKRFRASFNSAVNQLCDLG